MDPENNEDRIALLEKRITHFEKSLSSLPGILTQIIGMFEKRELRIINIEDILVKLHQFNTLLVRGMASPPQVIDEKLRLEMIDAAAKLETLLDQVKAANEDAKRNFSDPSGQPPENPQP